MTSCPLCSSVMEPWLTMPVDCKKEIPLAEAHAQAFRCPGCRYGAVLPRPDPREIASFYELSVYYTRGESHFAGAGTRSLSDRLREHLAWRADKGRGPAVDYIHDLAAGKSVDICDVGCGAGSLAGKLSARGHRVIGVDLDPNAATYALSQGVSVLQGSAEDLPEALTSRQFDIVIMSHVLEHCLDPLRALQSAYRLVRPGGLFYCEVPNNACAGFDQVGLAWEMLDIPRHLNFFVPANLRAAVTGAGFRIRSEIYTGYSRQFSNQWINTERKIHEAIMNTDSHLPAVPTPVKNSGLRAWGLLVRTAFASDELKYDSVGVVATKPVEATTT